jgi:Protein of unknown function (DUF3570)
MPHREVVVGVIKHVGWVSGSVTQLSKSPSVGLRLTPNKTCALSRTGYVNPSVTVLPIEPLSLNVEVGVTNPDPLISFPRSGVGMESITAPTVRDAKCLWRCSHAERGNTKIDTQRGVKDAQIVKTSLHALTAAALILPGIMVQPAWAAEGDEVDFQYGHYQEGSRNITSYDALSNNLIGQKNPNPIEVESLHGHAKISLTDRVKFAFNYMQDTWSGATPMATIPAIFGFNRALSSPDGKILSGSSPLIQDQPNGRLLIDRQNRLYTEDFKLDNRLTHIIATASPETRKQGDFKLSYDWDNAQVSVGGGISIEDDYESRFGNLGARWDFNQKRTSVNLGLSYTNSQTSAILDHDAEPYIEGDGYFSKQVTEPTNDNQGFVLEGTRQDWAATAGISHAFSQDTLLAADVGYTRSTGYQSNPYKLTEVIFVNPDDFQLGDLVRPNYVGGFLERRPEVRNQWGVGGRAVQYIEPLGAALHFDYKFSADDWGIKTHTFEADWVQPVGSGWTVTPRIRYSSQDAADFYAPYLVTDQAYSKDVKDSEGNPVSMGTDGKEYSEVFDFDTSTLVFKDAQGNIKPDAVEVTAKTIPYDPKKLPANFSSDQRLSGFGTLSGGVSIEKKFAKGLSLETGFEYYTHQGSLKIGGGGEGSYADYDYWVANAALKVDLDVLSTSMMQAMGGMDHSAHAGHDMAGMNHAGHDMVGMNHSSHHHGVHGPAGVMFDHMLANSGDMMVGYRYMYANQAGHMLHGANEVSDQAIVAGGCGSNPCFLTSGDMAMHMHMLDLMYAPTDWLTLMVMPMWMDMNMSMRVLDGAPPDEVVNNNVGNDPDNLISKHIGHHLQNGHETGGFGDLGMYALFKLFDNGLHHAHFTFGLSAPTADVDIQLNRRHQVDGGFIHYGMQLGSGTWDFKPSLTYTGKLDKFSWGAQLNGTVRMEDKNKSGYALGDMLQATAWGTYNVLNWLSASVRGAYTLQGGLNGQFNGLVNQFGPMDYAQNHGGKYWDVGFGLNAMIHNGDFAGNHFSVEWVQPMEDNVNGYQLDREGTLNATWGIMF